MAYDNTCKYLAETYPEEFAKWLLSTDTSNIKVLKTELNLEPIRADSNQILHIEFQTQPKSTPPLDLRMLNYYVILKRLYGCDIEQVIIFLQPSNSEMVFMHRIRRQKYPSQISSNSLMGARFRTLTK